MNCRCDTAHEMATVSAVRKWYRMRDEEARLK